MNVFERIKKNVETYVFQEQIYIYKIINDKLAFKWERSMSTKRFLKL